MSYEHVQNYQRATGRTTRMLKEAKRLAEDGRAVYVVFHNIHEARDASRLLDEDLRELGVKYETPETLGSLMFPDMVLRGAHPNVEVLVDHHVIEARYPRLVNMLRRFESHD